MNTAEMDKKIRDDLIKIFRAGVERVEGRNAVRNALESLAPSPPDYIVSVGKAATMAHGALDVFADKFKDGLVISKINHIDDDLRANKHLECIESDHPVPSQKSLDAGRRLLDYVSERAGKGRFLFLLSGGASSLVEVLPDGLTLDDVREINSALLAFGLDIGQMNALRRSISLIKGGRLAGYLGGSETVSLLISDVPGDDPATIGSGLLTPKADNVDWNTYPPKVRQILQDIQLPAPADESVSKTIETHIIAKLDDAKHAAQKAAEHAGYRTVLVPEFMDGDAREEGERLAQFLLTAEKGVYIRGGETSVVLPDNCGRGGRNQHLALAAAGVLAGNAGVYLLSAGTDGSDGVSHDAGGIVDGGTVERGNNAGLSFTDSMARADSGHFLEAAGDLVTTGPTGTNVMDLVIACKS